MTLGEVFRRIEQMGITQCRGKFWTIRAGTDVESCCAIGAILLGHHLAWYADEDAIRLENELHQYVKKQYAEMISDANDNGLLTFEELRQLP